MANTISTKVYRDVYRSASLGKLLRKNLVAEAICNVDRRGLKTIQNPYGSQPTATVQAISGTYTISDWTTTDDTLTVNQEFIYAEHVFDFEETLTRFDMFADRQDEQNYAIAYAIDRYVLNSMVTNAGGNYTTASGGFTTAANLPLNIGALLAKVAGYAQTYNGLYVVLEAGDLVGVIPQMATSGFSFADSVLRNGLANSYMGVDIYVVRSGTFANFTMGTTTFVNQGKRLFGVKNQVTYAEPQGIHFEEKGVSLKTGKEIVTYAYLGVKVWATNAALTIAITGTSALSESPSPSPSTSPSKSPSVSPS